MSYPKWEIIKLPELNCFNLKVAVLAMGLLREQQDFQDADKRRAAELQHFGTALVYTTVHNSQRLALPK